MNRKYIVELTREQREHLEKLISSGRASARMLTRARILLKSDSGQGAAPWSYAQIGAALDVSESTIASTRKAFVMGGLSTALDRKSPDREYEHRLDGEAEAHLIALVCGQPPAGRERWTLRLLAEKMVALEYVDTVSHETIRTTLKKTNSSHG